MRITQYAWQAVRFTYHVSAKRIRPTYDAGVVRRRPSEVPNSLAQAIIDKKSDSGQTLAQIAEQTGVTQPTVSRWTKGAVPDYQNIPALAHWLGMEPGHVIALAHEPRLRTIGSDEMDQAIADITDQMLEVFLATRPDASRPRARELLEHQVRLFAEQIQQSERWMTATRLVTEDAGVDQALEGAEIDLNSAAAELSPESRRAVLDFIAQERRKQQS